MTGLFEPTHLLIVLLVALLVFGPKRLPELGRSLGHGLREFKDSVAARDDQDHEPVALPPSEGSTEGNTKSESGSSRRAAES